MVKIKDLDMLMRLDILYDNNLIVYGAGDYGERAIKILEQLNIPIRAVGDSDQMKWGKTLCGYKIISMDEVQYALREESIILIIAMADPNDVEQVIEILNSYEMPEIYCYTYFALKFTLEFHINNPKILKSFRTDFKTAKKTWYEYWWRNQEQATLKYFATSILYDTILLLQPGKVGSVSILEGLNKVGKRSAHIHRMSVSNWPDREKQVAIDEYMQGADLLRRTGCYKVISLVRDPIARDISWFFQRLDINGYICGMEEIGDTDIYEKIYNLLENHMGVGRYGWIFEWFSREIGENFDIDIYQYDFDREKGYQIIHKGNVDLLLIKTEKLNDCQEVIGEFIGDKNFRLVNSNVTDDKLSRFTYEELKRTIKIPEYIGDFYYNANWAMDHFYTSNEKQEFIRKWFRK